MRKLCCFFCPRHDYEPHELTDRCPTCGRPLGQPQVEPPLTIGEYRVIRALPRGFYSAAYVVEAGRLRRQYVLKVVPKGVYEFFGKDFIRECEVHAEVARDSDHVVNIINYDDADVGFGDATLPCWVAQLDYVEGPSLGDFFNDPAPSARTVAQIAVDLLGLLSELDAKHVFHNDLHPDNIIVATLRGEARRPDQLDDRIRTVAIDLGSITDRSKTGQARRLGDLHEVAAHLLRMADLLLASPDSTSDADYRLAAKLSEVAHAFAPVSEMQRTPDYKQSIDDIRDAFTQQRAPWQVPARLRRVDESYNAGTLHPWFVPRLLVDPKGEWLTRVSGPGPQVVTGMRGCGKTMLLRGLELHARLAHHLSDAPDGKDLAGRLSRDGYLGLYVSCTRLLDILEDPQHELHEPYARLYLAYSREAIRALRHLRDLAPESVVPGHHRLLADAIGQVINGVGAIDEIATESRLERRVIEMLASLERREADYSMTMHPASAFPKLADAIKSCVPVLGEVQILFLLDDVSTRHLHEVSIVDLLSSLLFATPSCAFKMTTETQTLELALRSPALIEKARERRDYSVFDLGAAVNRQLKDRQRGGKKFIGDILQLRIDLATDQPPLTPEQRLGDQTLEKIARRIASTTRTSSDRKHVYHGITALTAICVGDIGDVITLYDMMTSRAGKTADISPEIQSACYQEYCSRRLYNVNRRNDRLKDFALTFAEAAHQLLLRSAAKSEKRGLRQYASIYVRLTAGDIARQMEQLRELIDAGVFVLEAGSDAPRAKTRDADPIHQFILTYRKLFGLSSYIGLADRDRFELSGDDLQEWLDYPERGTNMLMRRLTGPNERPTGQNGTEAATLGGTGNDEVDSGTVRNQTARIVTAEPRLDFSAPAHEIEESETSEEDRAQRFVEQHGPRVRAMSLDELANVSIDVAIGGLGFEERTEASAARLLKVVRPGSIRLVRYEEAGRSAAIRRMLDKASVPKTEISYDRATADGFGELAGNVLVDVTGLAKPVLFRAISQALHATGSVLVAHTRATKHYPLDHEIDQVFEAEAANDVYALLLHLDKLWSGEIGPYTFVKLLPIRVDDSRYRVLFASASPKHQRLLSLLDERDADALEILHPAPSTPRGRLAKLAADVALKERESGRLAEVESDDLPGALNVLGNGYYRWYVERGAEFEVALTGSKMHAAAAAAASVAYRLSQCWYVRPARFDPQRFTSGVGETQIVRIDLQHRGELMEDPPTE